MTECLGDFHQLDLRHAQAMHRAFGIDFEFQFFEQGSGAAVEFFVIDDAARAARLSAQPDIFGNGHEGDGFEFLRDHRDPGGQRIAWTIEVHRLAIQKNIAGISLSDPHEDAQKRRLACAVATAQGVDAAGAQRKSPIAQCRNAGVGLGDMFSLEQ